MYFTDATIDRFIKEDVPYLDLTTQVLGIGDKEGKLQIFTREEAVLSGTEEVARIFQKLNLQVIKYLPSGSRVGKNDLCFEAAGQASNLHMAWKVSLNILEYSSGIATRTKKMAELAAKVNPKIAIVTTRKNFPGTKELAIKAVLAGGGYPHRLGLSETVLIFKQHLAFFNSLEEFVNQIDVIKGKACEKKVILEVENKEEAMIFAGAKIDGLQFDKFSPRELLEIIPTIKNINPNLVLLAAGGINESNVVDYAKTGIDAIVTTSVYFGKPIDMGVKMTSLVL